MWNLWHGCHKKSEGCQHCYVYRRDAEFEKDSNVVTKTASFNLPIRRDRQGNWKVPSGSLMWTCFTSDFFIEEADEWREDAWLMIQRRSDLHFFMITKRPERIEELKARYDCIGKPYNESSKYWIGIDANTAPDELLQELTRNSYEIVKAKYKKHG